MRGIWFEEYERLYNEAEDGDPDPQVVTEAEIRQAMMDYRTGRFGAIA